MHANSCEPFAPSSNASCSCYLDADVELGLDVAVHGEPATAIDAVVNELAMNFQMSFLGRLLTL